MRRPINLQKIAKYVDNQAKEQAVLHPLPKGMQEAKQLIEQFGSSEKKTFTFTVGEMNAYLG